jgi:O-antigen/teichoic acid export membrane protein
MAHSLIKDSTVYGIGNLLNRALGLLLIPVYTRYLDVSEYGTLALLNLVLQQVSFICLLGIGTAAMRHYFDPGADDPYRQSVYGTATALLMVFPAVVLVALGPLTWLLMTRYVPTVPFFPYVFVVLLTGLFTPISKLLTGLLRARRRPLLFTVFNLAFFLCQTAAIYLALAVLNLGLKGQVLAQLSANGLFAAVALLLLAQYARPRFERGMARDLLGYGLPLLPFFIFLWLYEGAGRFMLEHYADLGRVGIFALAAQFAGLITLTGTALDNVMLPSFLEMAGKDGGARRLGQLILKYVTWLGLLGLVILVVASPTIRIVATEKYYEAEQFIPLLVLAFWLSIGHTPVIWSLNFSKRSATLSALKGLAVALLIGLLALFLGRWQLGINGVAAALIGAHLFNIIVGYGLAQRHFRLEMPLARSCVTVAVLLCGGAVIAWLGPAGFDRELLALECTVLLATGLIAIRFAGIGNPLRAFRTG